MRSFEELQEHSDSVLLTISGIFNDADQFGKLSDEEKKEMYKDYMYLVAKNDPRFSDENAQTVYFEILLGENGLDYLLDDVNTEMNDSINIKRFLGTKSLTDDIYDSLTGTKDVDVQFNRNKMSEDIKNGLYSAEYIQAKEREEHDRRVNAETERIADNLRSLNERERELEEDLGLSGDRRRYNRENRSVGDIDGDLDKIIAENKEALDYINELNQAEEKVEAEAGAVMDDADEIAELFPDNEKVQSRKENRRIFENAVDLANDTSMTGNPEIDNLTRGIREAARSVEDVPGGMFSDMPETEEEMKQAADAANAAKSIKEELDAAEAEGDMKAFESGEEATLEELFPRNEGVQSRMRERGHALNPEKAPEYTADEMLKMAEEFDEQHVNDVDYKLSTDEQVEEFKGDIKDAESFVETLNMSESKTEEIYQPEIDVRNAHFREMDRIEQIFLDQESFDKLSDRDKVKYAQEYLLHSAQTYPEYQSYMYDDIERKIKSLDITDTLDIIMYNLKGGENVLKELNSEFLTENAFKKHYSPYYNGKIDRDELNGYQSHVRGAGAVEKISFEKYGTYNGKEKPSKEKDEFNEEKELEELFADNEKVLENKEKKTEERIQQKKDIRADQRRIKEAEAKKNREMSNRLAESLAKGNNNLFGGSAGKASANEEYKIKNLSYDEAVSECEAIKEKFKNQAVFSKMTDQEKAKMAKNFLFAKGRYYPNYYDINLDFDIAKDDVKKGAIDNMYDVIYKGFTVDNIVKEVIKKVNNGNDFINILDTADRVCHGIAKNIDREYKDYKTYDDNVDLKLFNEKIKKANEKAERIEDIRKNPKKYDASYDNYITLHTGSKAGEDKQELINNLAKVCAAEKLKASGKKFSVKDVRKAAANIKEIYSLDVFAKLKDESVIRTGLNSGKTAIEFVKNIRRSLFNVETNNIEQYSKDMKDILKCMDKPDGRSKEYQRFYKSIKAVAEIDVSAGRIDDIKHNDLREQIINANEEILDSTLAYIKDKEGIRTQQKGKRAFGHAMDTISTLTKYAAGTNLCAMRVIDKINSVRTAKKQELIEKDIKSFTEKYGAERAVAEKTGKTAGKTAKTNNKVNGKKDEASSLYSRNSSMASGRNSNLSK